MSKSDAKPEGGIDPQLVERLAEIVARLDLSEIEVKHGSLEIRVERRLAPLAVQAAVAPPAEAVAAVPAGAAVVASAPAAPPAEHPGTVKSPMVGTAYLRPSPGTAAFVEIGSQVKAGDKILLVEAMKTFNEIIAPRAGTVTALLVEDGQPVEYGQPLIVIA